MVVRHVDAEDDAMTATQFWTGVVGVFIGTLIWRVLWDSLMFHRYPCSSRDSSHDWSRLGSDRLIRKCQRCNKTQWGTEYTPGLGIAAEGETQIRWSDTR